MEHMLKLKFNSELEHTVPCYAVCNNVYVSFDRAWQKEGFFFRMSNPEPSSQNPKINRSYDESWFKLLPQAMDGELKASFVADAPNVHAGTISYSDSTLPSYVKFSESVNCRPAPLPCAFWPRTDPTTRLGKNSNLFPNWGSAICWC